MKSEDPTVPTDVLRGRELADAQAQRLAPDGIAPEFLAEAIWHRTLAVGSPPGDAEVIEYLARCATDRVPVSGRAEHQQSIHPHERYRSPDGTVVVLQRRDRRNYVAIGILSGKCYQRKRSRTSIRRAIESMFPGGSWSYVLALRDRTQILQRWGLPPL